jgi:hypothetical protein
MGTELLDRLAAGRALADELHVRLRGEQGRHAMAKHRVIVHRQDANGR